jgi:nucleotide-binding universal stress UspA family protein
MSRTVVVGLDGSPESLAAADWAAREAVLRAAALRVVHAGEQQPHAYVPFAGDAIPPRDADLSARLLGEVTATLAYRHPGLEITAHQIDRQPTRALAAAAAEAELLVLGSRGLGRAAGFLLGSVASAVVARTESPVVLLRADADAVAEDLLGAAGTPARAVPHGDVVLGLDLHDPHDTVIGFAFDAASRRAAGLRVVHGWSLAPSQDSRNVRVESEPVTQAQQRLVETLGPWREKYPDVEVTDEAVVGQAGSHLADASRNASLVVVGRKNRHASLGPHIGPVTHAVLHHAASPVAVVPHD